MTLTKVEFTGRRLLRLPPEGLSNRYEAALVQTIAMTETEQEKTCRKI
jgi:hypothetical protein